MLTSFGNESYFERLEKQGVVVQILLGTWWKDDLKSVIHAFQEHYTESIGNLVN